MAFEAPRLSEMVTVLRRALRDSGPTPVFSDDALTDWVTEALADLNIFRPVERQRTIFYDPAIAGPGQPSGLDPADYAEFTDFWQIEMRINRAEYLTGTIIPFTAWGESDIRNGWDYYDGLIRFGGWWIGRFNELFNQYPDDGLLFALLGYCARKVPGVDPEAVLDLKDTTDYLCLVRHVRMLGFQTLEADRGLYQQWLAATNNTDVSPTQLQGMRNQAESSYDRLRKQTSRAKRTPTTGIQYQS